MHTRIRTTVVNQTPLPVGKQVWDADSPIYGYSRNSWAAGVNLTKFPDSFSSMTDVVGNSGGDNPVEQWSISSQLGSFAPWARENNTSHGSLPLMEGVYLPGGTSNAWGFMGAAHWWPEISAATLSGWAVDAFNKFHDQVPVTVSLPNFIYELREMKSMIPSFDRKSLSKTASNNFLAFEFGVQPFISDIKAILDMSSAVDKRLSHLLATQGKETNLSFNRDVDFAEDFSIYLDANPLAGSVNGIPKISVHFKRLSGKATFHVGAKLFQDLQDLSDSIAKLKALSASGGFSHPARVVWNAIPYSFVVDWFFHVGKLLDTLTIQPFGGEYKVTRMMHSIKSTALYYVTQEFHNEDPVSNGVNNTPLGTLVAKSYVRRTGLPLSGLFLTDGALSPTQLALSAAMLEQRRR